MYVLPPPHINPWLCTLEWWDVMLQNRLALFCCYRPSFIGSQQSWFWVFLFQFSNFTPWPCSTRVATTILPLAGYVALALFLMRGAGPGAQGFLNSISSSRAQLQEAKGVGCHFEGHECRTSNQFKERRCLISSIYVLKDVITCSFPKR